MAMINCTGTCPTDLLFGSPTSRKIFKGEACGPMPEAFQQEMEQMLQPLGHMEVTLGTPKEGFNKVMGAGGDGVVSKFSKRRTQKCVGVVWLSLLNKLNGVPSNKAKYGDTVDWAGVGTCLDANAEKD